VAHFEMSVSDPYAPETFEDPLIGRQAVARWAEVADGANEACLVVDVSAYIAAVSASACTLLGFANPEAAIGQCLYAGVLPLVDFTSAAAAVPDVELNKIPPVQALRSEHLARGLMRVRQGTDVITVDAVSTPLWEAHRVVGSLTFFCLV
jgi:hypothetical protein